MHFYRVKKKAPPNVEHNVALKFNSVNKKGAFEGDKNMLLELPGVSITKKPRADGRFQGYIKLNDIKHYVYGRTADDVLLKIQRLVKYGAPKKKNLSPSGIPTTFDAFAQYYFKNFRVKKVSADTMKADLYRYNRHIKATFKDKPLKRITSLECQNLIEKLSTAGKRKTADEVFSLLNLIFKMAIKHDLIKNNPLDIIYRESYEKKHGTVLSAEQVKEFRLKIEGDEFQLLFLIALYTGLRPNELKKFKIENDFIIAINSKRKNGKVEYKRIPVMKGLKPFLNGNIALTSTSYQNLRKRFQVLMPGFTLKDLRKTFNSRCIECGINDTVRKLWVGHSLGELGKTYTELSDKFMLLEAEKFFYDGD